MEQQLLVLLVRFGNQAVSTEGAGSVNPPVLYRLEAALIIPALPI